MLASCLMGSSLAFQEGHRALSSSPRNSAVLQALCLSLQRKASCTALCCQRATRAAKLLWDMVIAATVAR